jgi:D-amino-acid dehydrogenase
MTAVNEQANVVVVGAGVIGVTTAWYLRREGARVTVVDRQPGPALETSFANGGQISTNHATPWATPEAPWQALKWLGKPDAPLLIRPRWDPALFAWLLRFLANCTRPRMETNIARALRLALYSRDELDTLRRETGLRYDALTHGILHIFRNRHEFDKALPQVDLMNRLGCTRRVVDAHECLAIEPALAAARHDLVGGIMSPDDESGDAHLFTVRLAERCAAEGVSFRYRTPVRALWRDGDRITALETADGPIRVDAVVLAGGSHTPLLLRPLGIRLPVYPGKGYSVTLPIERPERTPTVSIIDDEVKMVYSRLGNRLRVAGTAEFAGYDSSVDERRARFLLDTAIGLFPGCADPAAAAFWAGLRPSTPDGVPVIGRTRLGNLYLNTGHGTLGWTMACGSGRVVADMVLGRTPAIALDGLGIERFG